MSFGTYVSKYLWKYLLTTLEMVGITVVIGSVLGILLGSLLYFTRKSRTRWVQMVYKVIDFIVGLFRSFPFYILIFVLLPFTRLLGLDAMSNEGFIVPLTIAAIPFIGKIVEAALIEVNEGVVEAATALGLSPLQIIVRVVLREALPAIVSGITLSVITLIGYSAMSSAVGADSLGSFAYNFGFTSYDTLAMMYAVGTLVVLVVLVQALGNLIYKLVK